MVKPADTLNQAGSELRAEKHEPVSIQSVQRSELFRSVTKELDKVKLLLSKEGVTELPSLPQNVPSGFTVATALGLKNAYQARMNCIISFSMKEGSWAHLVVDKLCAAVEHAYKEGESGNVDDALVEMMGLTAAWILEERTRRNGLNEGA